MFEGQRLLPHATSNHPTLVGLQRTYLPLWSDFSLYGAFTLAHAPVSLCGSMLLPWFFSWLYASALLEQNVPFRPHSLRPFWRLAQWFELQWTHKASVLGETQTSVTQCFISFRCLILQACSQDNDCMFPVDVLVIVSHMYGSSWIISILNS